MLLFPYFIKKGGKSLKKNKKTSFGDLILISLLIMAISGVFSFFSFVVDNIENIIEGKNESEPKDEPQQTKIARELTPEQKALIPDDAISAAEFVRRYNQLTENYPFRHFEGFETMLYDQAIDVYPDVGIKLNGYFFEDYVRDAILLAEDFPNTDQNVEMFREIMNAMIGAYDNTLTEEERNMILDALLVDGLERLALHDMWYDKKYFTFAVDEWGAIGFTIERLENKPTFKISDFK